MAGQGDACPGNLGRAACPWINPRATPGIACRWPELLRAWPLHLSVAALVHLALPTVLHCGPALSTEEMNSCKFWKWQTTTRRQLAQERSLLDSRRKGATFS